MKNITLGASDTFSTLRKYMDDPDCMIGFNPKNLPSYNDDQIGKMRKDVQEGYLAARVKAQSLAESKAAAKGWKEVAKDYLKLQGDSRRVLNVSLREGDLKKSGARAVWINPRDVPTKLAQGYIYGDDSNVTVGDRARKGQKGAYVIYNHKNGVEYEELVCMIQPGDLRRALEQRREELQRAPTAGAVHGANEEALEEAIDRALKKRDL